MFREGDVIQIVSKEHYPTCDAGVEIGEYYKVRGIFDNLGNVDGERLLVSNWFVNVNDVELVVDFDAISIIKKMVREINNKRMERDEN